MGEPERHALVQRLGQEMSDLSEDCWCAGWLGGTEYFVPELCRRAVESGLSQFWGHGEITPRLAGELVALAELAGCWADTDYYSVGYDPFQPFPIPPEYIEAVEREQSSRYAQSQRAKHAEQNAADGGS